ncbi:hypothetical protein LLH03_13865 [bacterium]|nr:hypothetical protein [bacterium]
MGHERIGVLPKSKRWRSIVADVGSLTGGEYDVGTIAGETLRATRSRLRWFQDDPAPLEAFSFLVELSVRARTGGLSGMPGLDDGGPLTPLRLVRVLRSRLASIDSSPEYRELSAAAGADALALWYQTHRVQDVSLFEGFGCADSTWDALQSGRGFCELSRLFFSKIVERYLRYFLERELSAVGPSLSHSDQVRADLQSYLADVSQHALETSKITQSLAAGWFNKHAQKGMPPKSSIRGVFNYALTKLRDEMTREGSRA